MQQMLRTSIAAGVSHTCAITKNGDAYCWGLNNFAQLGDGTSDDSSVPVAVLTSATDNIPLTGVTAISAGLFHSCAVAAGSAYPAQ